MSDTLARIELQGFAEQLNALLEQLQQEEQELLADIAGVAPAQPDETDMLRLQLASLTAQMAACRKALLRVESGEYGCCEDCGEVIELNHLMADPTTCRCVRCRRLQSSSLVSC